jgi:hypothetical protein
LHGKPLDIPLVTLGAWLTLARGYQQHRARRQPGDIMGHTAQENLFDKTFPLSAHDD